MKRTPTLNGYCQMIMKEYILRTCQNCVEAYEQELTISQNKASPNASISAFEPRYDYQGLLYQRLAVAYT